MLEGIECPKCGKHTIVKRSETLFQCICCDFKRDLEEKSQADGENSENSWLNLLLTFLLIFVVFTLATASTFPETQKNSSYLINPVEKTAP